MCANGAGVSTFFWAHLARYFVEAGHRVVVWDYRGHGSSTGPNRLDRLDVPACADDLLRVMDDLDIADAVLVGHSLGCQVIFETWRKAPRRVLGLVPMLGGPGRLAETFLDPRVGKHIIDAGDRMSRALPEVVSVVIKLAAAHPATLFWARALGVIHKDFARDRDLVPYVEHMSRIDPRVFFRMVQAAQEHDASPWLEEIDVPTLVVAGERDIFTPHHLSMEMARRIPQAELLEIPAGSHAALVEQPLLINLRIEKMLAGPVAEHAAARENVVGLRRSS